MTSYEALSLISQFSLVLIAVLTLFVTIVVYMHKKK
ncbi:putative holin-like toxin [Salipaludibacillus sp. CUR1]|nr:MULTISPECIES: putative holin-like toxin [Salipaludibacillus]MCE7792254.1 putative holin-like toxin [Salipaludibacillus sp. CUR1]